MSGVRLSEATTQRTTEDVGLRIAALLGRGSTPGPRVVWQWHKDAKGRTVAHLIGERGGRAALRPGFRRLSGRRTWVTVCTDLGSSIGRHGRGSPRSSPRPCSPDQELAAERADCVGLRSRRARPLAQACRPFGLSRGTGPQWLRRATPAQPQPLRDRSRRPHTTPQRTPPEPERPVAQPHDDCAWDARAVHAPLRQRGHRVPGPSAVHTIRRRHGQVAAAGPAPPPVRFRRRVPNHLWPMGFKGPLAGAPAGVPW